ncbi:MAG: hypothetical protein GF387_01090 [Candidatus Portnoybacteria bacterium]|nr:hypothetical protein [Candidatus Portnoybacteria bacterium]
MKKIIIIALITIIIAGAWLLLKHTTQEEAWICKDGKWIKHGNPERPMPTTGCGQPTFNENGYLVQGIIAKWSILYDKPGKPALRRDLIFNQESTCLKDQEQIDCSELKKGIRIDLIGKETGNKVEVIRIITEK